MTEGEEGSPGILSNPGDCNPHSGGISFAVGEDKPNQQQSALYVGVFSDVGER